MNRRRKPESGAQDAAPKSPRKRATKLVPAAAEPAAIADVPTRRQLIQVDMPVRWRDLDAFSHVNNSTFLTYIEEARLQWFQSLPGPWLSEDIAPVLAATHVNYRRPIEWPERLVVELFADRIGNTSLTIGHRILSARDAEIVYSDGHSVLVWIDRHGGRPASLPEAVRRACEGPA
jgi:acyl-CoA thioester hydrolase